MEEALLTLANRYPYLAANLCGVPIFLVGYAVAGSQRRMMIMSALAIVPATALAVIFEPEYWTPVRLGGWILGIEDVLFSFLTGGMAWLIAVLPFRSKTRVHETQLIPFLKRGTMIGTIVIALVFIFLNEGFDPMATIVAAQVLISALLLILRCRLWPFAVIGMIGYTIFHFVELKVWFWMWPDFVLQWNQTSYWAIQIVGLPLGEIVSTAAFGLACPLFIGYIFNVSLIRPEKNS